jgi:hypothetical protein
MPSPQTMQTTRNRNRAESAPVLFRRVRQCDPEKFCFFDKIFAANEPSAAGRNQREFNAKSPRPKGAKAGSRNQDSETTDFTSELKIGN